MRFTRLAATVAAALLAVPLLGAPASADAIGGGADAGYECDRLHCVQVTYSLNVQPTGLGYSVVEFQCTAIGVIDPAATGIDSCSVGGESALLVPVTFPGAYATAVGTTIVRAGSAVDICASAHAEFVENRLGALVVNAGFCDRGVVIHLPSITQA